MTDFRRSSVAALLLATGCVLSVTRPALAQGTSAAVSGFVTDASGAKVPMATVTYTNTSTGIAVSVTTNGAGLYRIPGLLPGNYRSSVTAAGFKTAVRDGIDLKLEDQVSLDYALDLGSVSETVTVSSAATLLETTSPTVSQVIEGRQVEETPLNGRNTMNLVALTPGVVAQGATNGAASNNTSGGSFTNAGGFNNYSIAGGLAGQGSVYIDGAPINATVAHVITFIITQDAVQEFRVETSVVNPQYGEFNGGVISFETKSGGNNFHGSAYEYLRNTLLNANNFFNNETGQPRPSFIQNQFGATLGGPFKKEKAFFFASYEGYRLAQGVPNVGRVPTTAELGGDFRADGPIFDPATIVRNAAGVVTSEKQFSCNGVANVICQPGTVGMGTTIDPTSNVVGNVVKYFPTPNTTTAGAGINFSQNGKASASNAEYTFRADANLSSSQKLFARYTRLDRYQPGTQLFTNNTGGPTSGPAVGATSQQEVLGDTVTLNTTSVFDLRASYLRYVVFVLPVAMNVNLSQFGPFYAGIAPKISYQEFPNIVITNNVTQPFTTNFNQTQHAVADQYVLSGTYSKLLGRHSISFGGETRRREQYVSNTMSAAGAFNFAGSATGCAQAANATICQNSSGTPIATTAPGAGATPIADFVIGTITSAPLGIAAVSFPSAYTLYGGLFATDTFQISPKTTITAGVRYELPSGFREKNDKNTVLLPQLANPLVLVNSTSYASRSDLESHLTLFSPRIGIAYQPQPGTSIRAGYGLAYLPFDTGGSSSPYGSPINNPTTFVAAGAKLSAPLGGTSTSPNTTVVEPIGRAYNGTQFLGQPVSSRIPISSFPYLQQWNANLQQALSGGAVLQIAYLGARGVHEPLTSSIDINQLPDQYDGLTAATLTAMGGQKLRPYPIYQNVNAATPYYGDLYYQSLQTTFNKRFRSGGTLLANYSWSKVLSNAESNNGGVEIHQQGAIQDFDELRAEKSYLSFDVPQHLVVSYILDLPIGKGQRFLANSSRPVEEVISGWSASGINNFQSGFPLAITATANTLSSVYGAGTIRPNVVVGCNKRINGPIVNQIQQGAHTLNAACFTAPAATSFGNEPRTDGLLRTQGVDNWDFSVGKVTPISDTVNVVFRAEAFNVFNRVQFGDPNTSSASALFGVITTQANSPRSFQFSLRMNY